MSGIINQCITDLQGVANLTDSPAAQEIIEHIAKQLETAKSEH